MTTLEKIDQIKVLAILVSAFLFLSCCIIFSEIYYTHEKYGWIYNTTTIINNEIIEETVYLKNMVSFLGLMFLITCFIFMIVILSQQIERDLKNKE
jgi:hypothetical protein